MTANLNEWIISTTRIIERLELRICELEKSDEDNKKRISLLNEIIGTTLKKLAGK